MKKQKIAALLSGIFWATALLIGICLLPASDTGSMVSGIVVICLSLASGMLVPNPISLWALIAGICMIVFPGWAVGLVLCSIGAAGALANLIIWLKRKKTSTEYTV